jgi:hypothetical protein
MQSGRQLVRPIWLSGSPNRKLNYPNQKRILKKPHTQKGIEKTMPLMLVDVHRIA